MKTILKIFAFVLLLFSFSGCYKDEEPYYKKQAHDPELIGFWEAMDGTIFEYSSDSYIYRYDFDEDGNMQKRKYMLWYTKDGKLYEVMRSSLMYNGQERQSPYWFSDDKTELFINYGTPSLYHYVRVESVE